MKITEEQIKNHVRWSEIKKEKHKDLIDKVYQILAYGPNRPLYDTATEVVFLMVKELRPTIPKGIVDDDGYGPLEPIKL